MSETFSLSGHEFITLNNLLKVEGWCESGAVAKQMIEAGHVSVDDQIETRKRCKIFKGQRVDFNGNSITITD